MARPTNAEQRRKKREAAIQALLATERLSPADLLNATKQLERIEFERLHAKPKFKRDAADRKARRKSAGKKSGWGTVAPVILPPITPTPVLPAPPSTLTPPVMIRRTEHQRVR